MSHMYRFGEFLLDARRRTLSRADSAVLLTPKAFDVLVFLVQNPNRLVSKEELLQAVWGDTFVEEGNLTQYISHLRKALGDNSEDARWIVTIARKGYQFAGDVVPSDEAGTARHAADQVPVTEKLQSVASTGSDLLKTEKLWHKEVVVFSAIFVLALMGYLSWRHLQYTATSRTERIRLAVLPFENLTGDPNQEYLADGLTEGTISQLSQLNPQQLGVIARTSVMRYKHKEVRLDQIGHDLSVQYVLENSLRENGGHIRLTTQLIQVKDQTHLWSRDYDYLAQDILALQDDVGKAVAHEIQIGFTPERQAELSRLHPANPGAFDAYLQGHYFFQRNTDKDTDMAAKYFQRATELDPSYALAWVGLSRVRKWQAYTHAIPAEDGNRRAREAVERALALNSSLAQAYVQLGRIKQQVDFDWVGADASFQRALVLEPGNPESVRMAAFAANMLGRFDEALQLGRRAVDLDPLNADSREILAEVEFFMGQLDEAAADSKKALELSPDVWPGPFQLTQIYVMQGKAQDALAEIALVRDDSARTFLCAIANHALGREKAADTAVKELIAKYPRNAYRIAQAYAFRNRSDEAFKWLDRAYAQRESGLIGTKVDPLLKSLRKDPRYAVLLKKLDLPT